MSKTHAFAGYGLQAISGPHDLLRGCSHALPDEENAAEGETHNAQSREQWILHSDPGLPIPWLIKQNTALPSRA